MAKHIAWSVKLPGCIVSRHEVIYESQSANLHISLHRALTLLSCNFLQRGAYFKLRNTIEQRPHAEIVKPWDVCTTNSACRDPLPIMYKY